MTGWALMSCAREWCGPGTIEVDRQCVALAVEPPAPVVTEPSAEPSVPSVRCGPGTVEVEGYCVPEETPPDCGPGTVIRGDTCVALALQFVYTPFAAGAQVPVSQGNHGYFSHNGRSAYAVDWVVDEGTEVVAARAGKVVELREDSDQGCGEPECSDLANFVVLDHGDATTGLYFHLQQDGVLVELGQVVGAGEVIALSGNTGWSTGPHLHFQTDDLLGQSLPLYWEDQPEGMVFGGGSFVSGNVEQPAPDPFVGSTCPVDLFSHLAVELDPGIPCARVEGALLAPVGATSLVPGAQVMLGLYSTVLGDWTYRCTGQPSWSGELEVPADQFQGYTFFVAAAADEYCATFQGWDASVYLPIGP
jgi:hypothetical protein